MLNKLSSRKKTNKQKQAKNKFKINQLKKSYYEQFKQP